MSFNIQGWKWQLVVVGALCVLILPPIYRGYTKRTSHDRVTREEVIGCWIQNENTDVVGLRELNSLRSFAVFESDGKYYIGIKCSSYSCSEAYTGNWYYSDERNYFLKFIPWGYQAWIRLNISHHAGPQFYFTKKSGELRMYRGDYRAAIPEIEFRRTNELESEKLKNLANQVSNKK